MRTGNSDLIRTLATQAYIEPARKHGASTVEILAGDVQKALNLHGRTPQVCNALKSEKFLKSNGLKLLKWEGPRSGQSTTVKFIYQLLSQEPSPVERAKREKSLDSLWGIGKELFQSLGGGESFIRGERDKFYGKSHRP